MIPYFTNQVPLTSAVREPNPFSPPSLRFPAKLNVLERRRQHVLSGFNTFLFLSRFVGFNIIMGTVLRDTISIIKRISKTVPVISSVIFILRSSGGKERLLLIVPTALFFLGSQPVVIVGDFFGRRTTHRTAYQDVCLMLQHYDPAGWFLVCSLFHCCALHFLTLLQPFYHC